MIAFLRRWRAKRRHEKILAVCRREGHHLTKRGEMEPAKMIGGAPVASGPAEFWFMGCLCGYTEVNDAGTAPYTRSFEEAEQMKSDQGVKQ